MTRALAPFLLGFLVLLSGPSCTGGGQPSAPAGAVDGPGAATASPVHGRIEQHAGLRVLRVWGTARQRGHAHGTLLASEVATVAIAEFQARFARRPGLLEQARAAVGRLIEYPDDVHEELQGLWQGLQERGVDLGMPELERSFDFTDLLIANALDVFGLMGCSGFTVWGEQAVGGGVLTARNFDWPMTGAHMLDQTILMVSHLPGGRAVAAVTWPGFVGAVTGVADDGVAASLHVGTAKITYTPEPSSWPSAIAVREILAHGAGASAATIGKARELLGYTSPPAGFLTHLVLPSLPPSGPPAVVFETDAKACVVQEVAAGPVVVTNHFRTRNDGREASRDSLGRERRLQEGLGNCIAIDDRQISAAEAWDLLSEVDRGGGHAFGTLHSLVFRHDPWFFELRIGTLGTNGVVAAPDSDRRHALTRRQVFADGETFGR